MLLSAHKKHGVYIHINSYLLFINIKISLTILKICYILATVSEKHSRV